MSNTRSRRIGLLLFGLLSVGDIATLALTDGKTPPWSVAIVSAILGVASLYLVVQALRDPSRPLRLLVGLRILSAVTALPAFFVGSVPAGAVAGASAIVVLTAAAVLLVGRPAVAARAS